MIKKILGITILTIIVLSVAIPIIQDSTDDDKRTLNVIVLGGQSNGVYMPAGVNIPLLNETVPQPPATCWYYGNGYLHEMNVDGAWTIGSVDPAIAYEVAEYSNHETLVINVCVGGKSIDYFTPGNDGGDFIDEVVNTAMSRVVGYDEVIKVGWAWIQGESDADTPVDDYIADFSKIDAHFKTLGFDKCWISQTRTVDGGNAVIAQEKIVDTFPNVYWGSRASDTFTIENGLMYSDNLHYSQAGRIIIGEDIGSAMCSSLPFSIESQPYSSLFGVIPIILIVLILVVAIQIIISKHDY